MTGSLRTVAASSDNAETTTPVGDGVDLYWIPLGAGARLPIVRWNGLLFEALVARWQRRPAQDLYHAALELRVDGVRFVIEMTPAWGSGSGDHGVVGEGPVGLRWLGRSRYFRYQVRRWKEGVIPDLRFAVGGARRVAVGTDPATQVLGLVPAFPTATWGRDEQDAGDMWNSNSLVAWLLAMGGLDASSIAPPSHGRAPGWSAGLVVAARRAER